MKRFNNAIQAGMALHKMTQSQLADSCGTSGFAITKMLKGRKPNDELLRALCGPAWPDQMTGIDVAFAWLEDERERTGRADAEISIAVQGVDSESQTIKRNLEDIAAWIPQDIDLRKLIEFLAENARRELKAQRAANQPLPLESTTELAEAAEGLGIPEPKRPRNAADANAAAKWCAAHPCGNYVAQDLMEWCKKNAFGADRANVLIILTEQGYNFGPVS